MLSTPPAENALSRDNPAPRGPPQHNQADHMNSGTWTTSCRLTRRLLPAESGHELGRRQHGSRRRPCHITSSQSALANCDAGGCLPTGP
jgi:hypothetical protein